MIRFGGSGPETVPVLGTPEIHPHYIQARELRQLAVEVQIPGLIMHTPGPVVNARGPEHPAVAQLGEALQLLGDGPEVVPGVELHGAVPAVLPNDLAYDLGIRQVVGAGMPLGGDELPLFFRAHEALELTHLLEAEVRFGEGGEVHELTVRPGEHVFFQGHEGQVPGTADLGDAGAGGPDDCREPQPIHCRSQVPALERGQSSDAPTRGEQGTEAGLLPGGMLGLGSGHGIQDMDGACQRPDAVAHTDKPTGFLSGPLGIETSVLQARQI